MMVAFVTALLYVAHAHVYTIVRLYIDPAFPMIVLYSQLNRLTAYICMYVCIADIVYTIYSLVLWSDCSKSNPAAKFATLYFQN